MYFIKAQEQKHEWWKYPMVIFITFFFYMIIGAIPFLYVISYQQQKGIPIDLNTFKETSDPTSIGLSMNSGLILLLLPSVMAFFILLIAISKFHHLKIAAIVSAFGKIRWSRLVKAALMWSLLLIIAEAVFYSQDAENYTFHFEINSFIPLLIIALILIPFQAWFEELLFRGYLMQGLGLLFRIRLVAVILTAFGFGLLHAFNPEVQKFGLLNTMPYYIGFGLFTGLLVVFDNGIEIACGIHAINNIYSAVFVTYESSVLKTQAIWSIKSLNPWSMNVAFLTMASIFFIFMAHYYKWTDWKKLFRPIPKLSE